ncbi:MAG: T9SS type A sorting domain-containing protein, partial [Flavobacteriales bacterium]|nr:T9SS type A sorting domain-containing protein [Flavobacteriales bacterium]
VLATFAISVLWDTTGYVCVRETNQDGCVGDSVCMDVIVLDDVWSVGESALLPRIVAYPNPASDMVTVSVGPELVGQPYAIFNALGAQVGVGRFDSLNDVIDVKALPAGQYLLKPFSSTGIAVHVLR